MIVIAHVPSLPLDDVMYSIPSMPLSACSSGVVTADSDRLGARAVVERDDA